MEITKSDRRLYGFTLRKVSNTAQTTIATYEDRLAKIRANGIEVRSHSYEYEHGLHCHGIFVVPKSYKLERFRVRGWKMHLTEIYDELGWNIYMMKAPHNTEDDQVTQVPINEDVNPTKTKKIFKPIIYKDATALQGCYRSSVPDDV